MVVQMEHEALTIADDQKQLLDGAIRVGEFASRSGAMRTVLAEYFESDIERTAALVATSDSVDFEDVITILDVDVERFAERVRAIDVEAVPDRLSLHLDQGDTSGEWDSVLDDIRAEIPDPADRTDEDGGDT
jgi:Arc/MetJ-type ribon-helix-helix transcriptional regulator